MTYYLQLLHFKQYYYICNCSFTNTQELQRFDITVLYTCTGTAPCNTCTTGIVWHYIIDM